jgi:hypothetical protein
MQLVWMMVAAVAVIVAAVFLWQRDFNTAFIVAAVGAVAWFLNYRVQMKKTAAVVERDRAVGNETDNED